MACVMLHRVAVSKVLVANDIGDRGHCSPTSIGWFIDVDVALSLDLAIVTLHALHQQEGWMYMDEHQHPRGWEASPKASFARRLGKQPKIIKVNGNGDAPSKTHQGCPDIWELDNGDVAIIGRDLTESYHGRLPVDVGIDSDERIVVIPHATIVAAKKDIPDA